jgi:multidrug efflux pump subunit AcrA (membrane-fusion protein)
VELLPGQKLDPSAAQGLMIAADLLAPQLYDRFENDRWLVTKAGLSIRNVAEGIIGPRHMLAKVVTVLVAGALAFVFLYKPMYHVGATFQFVADERRVISAPIDQAHIKQVNKRPGDAVKAGDVLLQLDDSDLKVQKAQALAEVARAASEMHKHRGTEGEEALANISEAERDKAMAQVQLIQSRIDKCRVVSPVDGKVLTGDWWHKVQTPVKVGEELFVVAKGGDLRAEIKVADRDIQDVNVGDVGKLAVTSLPDDTHGFAITSIVGNGEPVEGENVFKVYADVKTQRPEWLPGMAGEARIDAGHRSVAWIWTHRLVDYVKMKLWL